MTGIQWKQFRGHKTQLSDGFGAGFALLNAAPGLDPATAILVAPLNAANSLAGLPASAPASGDASIPSSHDSSGTT